MSGIKLTSNDYLAISLSIKGKDNVKPEDANKSVKNYAEKLEHGQITTFKRDQADKISNYLSKRDENMGKAVKLWSSDTEISDNDFKLGSDIKKKIDTNNDGKVTTREFSNALVEGKVTIGENVIPPTIFKSDEEKGLAEKYLDRFSNNAFDPVRSVEDRFLNLKPINLQGLNANLTSVPIKTGIGDIDIDDLKGVKNNDEFLQAVKNSLAEDPKVIAALGPNFTDEQLDQYLAENLDTIAQQLGRDFPYQGLFTFSGDTDSMKTMEDGFGVCNDIHSVVTALRKSMGQEAYLVHTSSSDASHLFTIYKEDGKWNIQNYGRVIQTDATTIAELYDQAMPGHRRIKMYDVESDGNVKQLSTDHLTAIGLSERRFRGEAGSGAYNPWVAQEGLTISNNEISIAKNGFYLGVNPMNNTGNLAYYKKSQEGDTRKIEGASLEGQYFTNEHGYDYKHLDAKYEFEKKYDNADKQIYGREHFSVFAGFEMAATPTYWGNISDGNTPVAGADDPAVRLGVSYSRNDSKLYGDGDVKFELGHQTKVGTAVTFSGKDPLDPAYVGRILSDSAAESKLVTGVFYKPNKDLTIRAGLASGVDLLKIDGIDQPLEQLKNIAESDAYVDVSYGKGPIAVNAMGYVPLHTIASSAGVQYKVGAGIAYAPTKEFVVAATYIHEKVINDNIDTLRVGAEFRPTENIALGAAVSTPLVGDNEKDIKGEGYLKIKF